MSYSRKNPTNYTKLHNMFGTQVVKYKIDWTDLWGVQNGGVRENFFVAYAMDGRVIDKSTGNRAGLPVRHNLCDSPVEQPSPLNSEYKINCNKHHVGVS